MKTYYYNTKVLSYSISVDDIESKVKLAYKKGDTRIIKFLGIPIKKVKVKNDLYKITKKAIESPLDVFLLIGYYTEDQILNVFEFDPKEKVRLTLELVFSGGFDEVKYFYDENKMYEYLSKVCPEYKKYRET